MEKRFGTSAGSMTLVLKTDKEETIAAMNGELAQLGSFGIKDGHIVHCIDEDPCSILKEFEDLSSIEKYTMTDEEYDKLPSYLISECKKIQGKT